jgi:predicted dehydrogenase
MKCRIVVVGAGKMGKLHARVLSELDGVELAGIVDNNLAAATSLAKQRNCPAFGSIQEALPFADAAIIAAPTKYHLAAARLFVEAGKPALIEKPLSDDVAGAKELLALADARGVKLQVGHTERFNPAVLAIQKYDIQPKFIEAHRISPFTFRSADVGVVLDMMIHDIDLVLMLVHGAKVQTIEAVGVNVIGAYEDICNARLVFDNGCVANITASRLAIKTERKMRIFSDEAYLSVDYGKKVGLVVNKSQNLDLIQMARDMNIDDLADLAQSVDYTKLLKVEQLVIDDSIEPLRLQAQAFRDSVAGLIEPVVSARQGLAAVQVASDIVDHIKHHKWDGTGKQSGREGLDIITR